MKKLTKDRRRADARGFTLIELLVVIAVIGVLASISLLAMVTYREKAIASRVGQEVAGFQKAAGVFYAGQQHYPNPTTADNENLACYTLANGWPEKCCVSRGGCVYAGHPLQTLAASSGDFASAPRVPKWLALLGERAYAILGGTMPDFLTEAPTAVNGYKGIFYDCTDANCTDAHVYFTLPQTITTCATRGVAHNSLEGVCAQDITGRNEDGDGTIGALEDCDNGGIDDDEDGYADCDDSECAEDPACAGTPEDCSTADDEDGDGQGQCGDSDCFGNGNYCATEIANGGTCGDGKDNDRESGADCADSDCYGDSGQRSTYCTTETANGGSCSDGIDNDGDGQADSADSADCGVPENCSSSGDEDGNGYADCYDSACDTDSSCETGNAECSNGYDDDGQGGTDCNDAGCASASVCNTTPEDCSTAADEDGDGQGQCGDSDCSAWQGDNSWSSETSCSYQYCSAGTLTGGSCTPYNACWDSVDNNSDGCTDGGDYACGGNESGESACSDSSDNDCDGSMNCSDSGCAGTEACDPNNCACGSPYGTYTCGEFGADYCGDDPNNCSCY